MDSNLPSSRYLQHADRLYRPRSHLDHTFMPVSMDDDTTQQQSTEIHIVPVLLLLFSLSIALVYLLYPFHHGTQAQALE
jgi:hypothetical protein